MENLKEARPRGISGVDDNSLMQLKINTSNMIDHHFAKKKAWHSNKSLTNTSDLSNEIDSPNNGYESARDEEEENL